MSDRCPLGYLFLFRLNALMSFFLFPGETDNWKDYYTVKDNEELIELFNSRLKGKEFKLKSSL